MKKYVLDFVRRGLIASCIGPLVLVALYLLMQARADIHTMSVNEVCTGIVTLTALAFIAGGMNAIYQLERLPLMLAILIHGMVLYLCYLATYLLNGWLEWGATPVMVFTGIFVVGYLVIWAIIYSVVKKKTEKINQLLRRKQRTESN